MATATSTPDSRPQPLPRWRRYLKRAAWILLILTGILALFHRPLIFRGTKWLAVRLAKEQKLALEYDIDGSIFTTLRIRNLRARPIEPGPVERLEIGHLGLRYSFLDVIRHGLPAVLKDVELRDVWIELNPAVSVPRAKKPGRRTQFPSIFPERLHIVNLNLRSRAPPGDTRLERLDLDLDPAKQGALSIQLLDVPNVARWAHIAARTAVHDRQLVFADLSLGPKLTVRTLSLDVSKLNENRLLAALEVDGFGGRATARATIDDLNRSNHLDLEAEAATVPLGELVRSLWPGSPLNGSVSKASIKFAGAPRQPSGWSGTAKLTLDGLELGKTELGSVTITSELVDGRASLAASSMQDDRSKIAIRVDGDLPHNLDGFRTTKAQGRIDVSAQDSSWLFPGPGTAATGLTATVDLTLESGRARAEATLNAERFAFAGLNLTDLSTTVRANGDIETIVPRLPFTGLAAKVETRASLIQWRTYQADTFRAEAECVNGNVTLSRLELTNKNNFARITGNYKLPDEWTRWNQHPLTGAIEVEAPDIGAFLTSQPDVTVAGSMKLNGRLGVTNGTYGGQVTAMAQGVNANGLPVKAAEAQIQVADNLVSLQKLNVSLDDRSHLMATGEIGISEPHAYKGTFTGVLPDLAVLEPLLRAMHRPDPIGGSLAISWHGTGEARPARHSGTGTIELKDGRFGKHPALGANVTAEYSPQALHVSECLLAAGEYRAGARLDWGDGIARVSDLAISRRALRLIEGRAEFPLEFAAGRNLDALIPDDGPVTIDLHSRALNLASLFRELGQTKPPVSGTVSLDIAARGSLANLTGDATLRAAGIQAAGAKPLRPATAVIDATLRDRRLTAKGRLVQPGVAPIEISGSVPLDVSGIKGGRAIDPNTPIEAHLRLPRSSLDFVPALVPKVRALKGTVTTDVRVAGTINAPSLDGSTGVEIAYLRFTDPALPPINAASLRLGFTSKDATIRQFAGRVAGGSFTGGGNVDFQKLSAPIIDARLVTTNALLVQNDNLTARANSNLKLTGPFNAATLSGSIALTQSRFLKDIEVLPIGLPGRPAPKPPPRAAKVSFPNPPLRDWSFDVAVKTADPFLVEGNVANGRCLIDLKLKGTGLSPFIEGEVRTDTLMTSLPFSRLEVTSGRARFGPDHPFEPSLDIRARSTVRDYLIDVYVFGSPSAPQAVFTSQPPLPQSDIVALLATGTTTRELSEDPNILAGRAAGLLFKKYYHRFFKRNEPLLPEDSLFSNVQFDMGAVDPKSGRESLAVRVPLTDQIIVTGGVDVGGDFRGQVKYLVRFR